MTSEYQLSSAINDFRQARNQANLKEIIARFTGESTELLDYESVRQLLKAQVGADRGLREISLDSIIGSVNRYSDFTRDFLPLQDSDQHRWARVKVAVTDLSGLPPIEVYQIGETYFVKDGNHRVSVARQLGATQIQAYVTEVRTRIKLSPDIQPDQLIIKAEYLGFLEHTQLDARRPEADFNVTAPGQYPVLEEHISVHRWYMGIERQREISNEEAIVDWYDEVYLPLVKLIRERGILRNFPGRTETDLYLWIAEHRSILEERLGWKINTETALVDLVAEHGLPSSSFFSRVGERLLEIVSIPQLDSGPPVGTWRKEALGLRSSDRLFKEILVPITGQSNGWLALDQAIEVAQREGGHLHGLHVVSTPAEVDQETAAMVKGEFIQRCQTAGVQGELAIADGDISTQICSRSRWADLIVTVLNFPPPENPLERLDSGFRELIQRCPRPVLAVPRARLPISNVLLSYDGSPKAEEALFVATYLAGHWPIQLQVATVFEDNQPLPETLMRARVYLEERGIRAGYIAEHGDPEEIFLEIADRNQPDMIIMGGYGSRAVLGVVLGSLVDLVLRTRQYPVLICR